MPASLATSGASRSGHAEDVHRDSDQAPLTAGPVIKKNRLKRFAHAIMTWSSPTATIMMTTYQLIYFWRHLAAMLLPVGAAAWVVGCVLIMIYVVLKAPHLFWQEPGDAGGLAREVAYSLINILIATVFLTRAYDGVVHAPNSVGISVVMMFAFLTMLIAELVQAIILARRTWSDASGGPTN